MWREKRTENSRREGRRRRESLRGSERNRSAQCHRHSFNKIIGEEGTLDV